MQFPNLNPALSVWDLYDLGGSAVARPHRLIVVEVIERVAEPVGVPERVEREWLGDDVDGSDGPDLSDLEPG